ncbi:hypothetical protein ACHQM5_002167 [Ranunculus cassubicifolius]
MSARAILSRLSTRSPSLKISNSPLKCISQSQISDSTKRISRLPLSSLLSMLPLHSQIASARLTSILSVESQCWGMIPQGDLALLKAMPLVK